MVTVLALQSWGIVTLASFMRASMSGFPCACCVTSMRAPSLPPPSCVRPPSLLPHASGRPEPTCSSSCYSLQSRLRTVTALYTIVKVEAVGALWVRTGFWAVVFLVVTAGIVFMKKEVRGDYLLPVLALRSYETPFTYTSRFTSGPSRDTPFTYTHTWIQQAWCAEYQTSPCMLNDPHSRLICMGVKSESASLLLVREGDTQRDTVRTSG